MKPANSNAAPVVIPPTGHDNCWNCDGTGVDGHRCGPLGCNCKHPVDNITCGLCNGARFFEKPQADEFEELSQQQLADAEAA